MLQIIARAFCEGQLVGYVLTDGNEKQVVDKGTAWLYARNNQILNVKAIDNYNKATLTGVNGFELKKLPEAKMQNKTMNPERHVSRSDVDAAYIRYVVETSDIQPIEDKMAFYRADIQRGILTDKNKKSLSKLLIVESALYEDIVSVNGGKAFGNLLGYKIKNTSDQTLTIVRMDITSNHNKTTVELAPDRSICLNKAETTILASKPEVGEKFNNGELHVKVYDLKKATTLYDWLEAYFIHPDGGDPNKWARERVADVVPAYEAEKYFKLRKISNTTSRDIQEKGIFSAFKR